MHILMILTNPINTCLSICHLLNGAHLHWVGWALSLVWYLTRFRACTLDHEQLRFANTKANAKHFQ